MDHNSRETSGNWRKHRSRNLVVYSRNGREVQGLMGNISCKQNTNKENGNQNRGNLTISHLFHYFPFTCELYMQHINICYIDNIFIKDVIFIQYSFSDFIQKLSKNLSQTFILVNEKTTEHDWNYIVHMPNICLNLLNLSWLNPLVNMSAIISFVGQYLNWITLFLHWSRT